MQRDEVDKLKERPLRASVPKSPRLEHPLPKQAQDEKQPPVHHDTLAANGMEQEPLG